MTTGQSEKAIATLSLVLPVVAWSGPPGELDLVMDDLDAYREGRIPTDPWPDGDALLAPPPFDPVAAFRDYPAAKPY